ncbi:MAG TPA: hypothetical protein VHJ82_09200 [Actinomycetota bacterium]|nr:hypothetical protein [Actinomycetota bacterium]
MTSTHPPFLLAQSEPAGGAALEEILWASAVGLALVIVALAFGRMHRLGKTQLLTRMGDLAGRVTGLPAWAALPTAIAAAALLTAVFGFYWDVATHIDNGRDPGPFANAAHYLIIFGLLGIAFAGFTGALLGADRSVRSSIRFSDEWFVPVGALLLIVCGSIAVLGFPLDDIWHRIFGQDVTLWGPTHIQMVGGAALSTLALWVLVVEGIRARGDSIQLRARFRVEEALVAGAFLIGVSALQAEFDYSVPQFRLLFHPVLLALSAAVALVPARIRLGRGGALAAVGFFLLVRGIVSLLVGPVLGHTTLHFPLYIVEAVAIELLALRVAPVQQVRFGAWCGLLVGTVGLAAEWAWSHLWMTMSWPAALWPDALLAVLAGVAGGILGGFIGRELSQHTMEVGSRVLALGTGIAIVACLVYPLPIASLEGRAALQVSAPHAPASSVRVELEPVDLARDALWFNVTAWQGSGSVVAPLEPVGDGAYRSTEVPIAADWKALLRLHTEDAIVAVPIYLPSDPAIPAPGVQAEPNVVRDFVPDKKILLREAKETPAWFSVVGYAVLGLIVLVWIATLGWGLRRMSPL